jgi:hypothetical protein
MPTTTDIEYIFTLPSGDREVFLFQLDSATFALIAPATSDLPDWTLLRDHCCPNCPLDPATQERCPLAVALVPVVHRLESLVSWDRVRIEVVSVERTVSHETSAQRAIGSMLNLLTSVSGCPHFACFRPMARFHLPFASHEEKIYRAASMYLLAQYFKAQDGQPGDFALNGLQEIYRNVQIVYAAIAGRLRQATDRDFMVNAVVFLDLYALAVQQSVTDSLGRLRNWFGDRHPLLPPSGDSTQPEQQPYGCRLQSTAPAARILADGRPAAGKNA